MGHSWMRPQLWLWTVIPASAFSATPKEKERKLQEIPVGTLMEQSVTFREWSVCVRIGLGIGFIFLRERCTVYLQWNVSCLGDFCYYGTHIAVRIPLQEIPLLRSMYWIGASHCGKSQFGLSIDISMHRHPWWRFAPQGPRYTTIMSPLLKLPPSMAAESLR